MDSGYFVLIFWGSVIFLGFIIGAINYIRSYPKRKLLREQKREIDEILGGLKVHQEKAKILTLLKESLPDSYRCGRKNCNGTLLKQGTYYICSNCHNMRTTIRMPRVVK